MQCRHHVRSQRRFHNLAAMAAYAEVFPEKRTSGGSAQTNKHGWCDNGEFFVEPRATGANLRISRLFVNAPLPALCGRPLEVLDRIGEVHIGAVDPSFSQGQIQNPSRRPYERAPLAIFDIPRLLADQHDGGMRRTFAEDRLSCTFPEITLLALCCRNPKLLQGTLRVRGGALCAAKFLGGMFHAVGPKLKLVEAQAYKLPRHEVSISIDLMNAGAKESGYRGGTVPPVVGG